MDYLKWNNAIGARFFNPDRSGVRVFLYVTKDVITEIGAPHDADLNDFIAAVKTGPRWNTRLGRGVCQQALQALEGWRIRNFVYPPYLNYLALFVLADTVDVGFARHAYYPGLRSLLGEEPETGMYPSFLYMYRLWEDLAVWSNQDKQGDWGIFDADIVGEWRHVGLPRAQTLVTDRERGNLPFLFAEKGFDPHSPPSDREFAYLLTEDPHHRLRPRTKELLRSKTEGDSSIRAALIEVLLGELEHWDGSVTQLPHEDGHACIFSRGILSLAMVLDRTAGTARLSLRCRTNREYPDEGLQLIGEGMQEPLYCYEDWQGWSTPLSVSETQPIIFDPSRLDWIDGLSLIDREHSWKTTFSNRPIRVMVSATPFGFDGFVEHSQIPRGKPFYLLANNECAEKLLSWGNECCDGFSEVNLTSGLPEGWRLYGIGNVNSDALIRDDFPFLAFPSILRIHFRGGLRVKGNQYFTFALPQLEVTGAFEGPSVFCNDHRLDLDPETGMYTIPDAICAHRLIVEVRRDGECICRRSLYALETVAWRDTVPEVYLDKFGRHTESKAGETCVGPIVDGFTPPDFNPEIYFPPGAGHRVYFVGRNPGEIVECPNETIPMDWHPVWAIVMQGRGKGTAVYCGTDLANEEPGRTGCKDQKRCRRWRNVLWYSRKRITEPPHPTLRSLWGKYKEVARHVR
ncbi:MAG: hypothetical protein HY788_03870 [Deltaproteobacteria bacterium]|nr:hypothetical protein [Deltaproteobacteria bacterium]